MSGLVDRHIVFLEALRGAGVPVSLAEDLDAVAALSVLPWDERATVRDAYAATLVKRHSQRPTFDALFDLYFPRLVGQPASATDRDDPVAKDGPEALADLRERLAEALSRGGGRAAAPGRRGRRAVRRDARPCPGLSGWSAYTALRRVSPAELTERIVSGLVAGGRTEEEARRAAGRRVGGFAALVEGDARRRIAEEKGPDHVADVALRPTIDRLDFSSARKADLEEMRREIYPLARRLATRLAREQHARRRGPLDCPAHGPGVAVLRRGPAHDPPPAPCGRTAPSWSRCATSAGRWPASRRSRCCSSSRCASSSPRSARSRSSTGCTR